MSILPRSSSWRGLVLAIGTGLVLAAMAWKALRDPRNGFLPPRPGATWIVDSSPLGTWPRNAVEMETVFRRRFALPRAAGKATLRACWFRQGTAQLNGVVVAASSARNWKRSVEVDVSRFLRAGDNELVVRTRNDVGPPALWLSLSAPNLALGTDENWESSLVGSSWRPARAAGRAAPPPASSGARDRALNPSPLASARANGPLLATMAIAGAAFLLAARAWSHRRAPGPLTGREAAVLFALAAVAWTALFWNDRHLDPRLGFDSTSHLRYVAAVLERHHLPLADEGWEMYHPPLYYLVAAGLLRASGHVRLDADAILWLRALGWAIGLAQCAIVLAALRRLFGDRLRPLLAGFALAVFLPAQLYISLYFSNEGLLAALCSLALLLAIAILQRGDTSIGPHLGLGVVLGLAMLTKFSALLVVLVIPVVLAGALLARGVKDPRTYARTLGSAGLATLVVCGWHYVRVWRHFGRPFVSNWDRAAGFAWWMDPGYATLGSLTRFGRSLDAPLLSAFHGLPDALYSTLWGDGLLGGAASLASRPPWSYGLTAVAYLLALVPTLALVVGAGAAVRRMMRTPVHAPNATSALLFGTLAAFAAAVLLLALEQPSYAQGKAFYCLAALLPLCALVGEGVEVLGRSSRLAAGGLALLFAVWALASWGSFWVRPGLAPAARSALAIATERLIDGSLAAQENGELDRSMELARRATALAPDDVATWIRLADAAEAAHRPSLALAALRDAVRVKPQDVRLHAHLAALYASAGDRVAARAHAQYAE
ncbi:MAG TPA: hypothetical protein VN811_10080, partial [Thermoanaerobaculia bacterium]|nr:hypothetical protein [Thermoanaerobaculia bacterium]